MSVAIIASCDAPPVLEPGEQVLDCVALPVELLVVGVMDLAVGGWLNARRDASRGEGVAEPVAVVTFVGQQFLGVGQSGEQQTAPLWSLICPSVSNITMGRPWPSQTVWSFEFSPPLVRPIHRGSPPLAGSMPCGGP